MQLKGTEKLNLHYSKIMGNVVYLFGAGASFGVRDKQMPKLEYSLEYRDYKGEHQEIKGSAPNITEGLPVVSELPERMDYVRYLIKKEIKDFAIDAKPESAMFEDLEKDIAWLQAASRGHATVDTFAKKLWITHRDEEYKKLKNTLSAYFMLEQLLNKTDKRYDAFFASILGEEAIDLPSNVCILSWNYDCQFELAYSEYYRHAGLNDLENQLHFYHKTTGNVNYHDDSKFSIIKLNGSAFMYDLSTKDAIDPFLIQDSMRDIARVASICQDNSNKGCALSFAWEQSYPWFTDRIQKNIANADTLVVIGYSFPYFNRTMDKFLFKSMPGLKKIYLQDIDPDTIEQSVTNLLTPSHSKINNTKIEKKYHTQQFYLPPEL